MQAMNITSQQG